MPTALLIIAPVITVWCLLRWLLGPEQAPRGWDVVPEDWNAEAAARAMQEPDELRPPTGSTPADSGEGFAPPYHQ